MRECSGVDDKDTMRVWYGFKGWIILKSLAKNFLKNLVQKYFKIFQKIKISKKFKIIHPLIFF